LLPGFASGGPIPANMPAIVGEDGPELFMPTRSGTIVPNGSFGNTVHHHNIHVDARGATDPAEVEARIRRAAPSIIAASIRAQQDYNRRLPPSMKR